MQFRSAFDIATIAVLPILNTVLPHVFPVLLLLSFSLSRWLFLLIFNQYGLSSVVCVQIVDCFFLFSRSTHLDFCILRLVLFLFVEGVVPVLWLGEIFAFDVDSDGNDVDEKKPNNGSIQLDQNIHV